MYLSFSNLTSKLGNVIPVRTIFLSNSTTGILVAYWFGRANLALTFKIVKYQYSNRAHEGLNKGFKCNLQFPIATANMIFAHPD
jgi:hypothetical protein